MLSCGPAPFDPNTSSEYITAIVDPAAVPYAGIEVPLKDNIALVTDGGMQAVEFRILPSQPLKNNGIRAEIAVDYPYVAHDTIEYTWDMKLVDPFPTDAQNRWWLIAQWHDQPDRNLNQTWDNFPSHSPPISLGFGQTNGSRAIALTYGTVQGPAGHFPVSTEQWYSFSAKITWSQDNTGSITLTVSPGNVSITTNGPNMYNAFQHYFKTGMYRNKDIASENRVRIRNIKMRKW